MSVGKFLQQAAAGNAGGGDAVFSTYLYDGTGSAQTITNNVNLDGEGGLVWIKSRGPSAFNHILEDTARGADRYLRTNTTNAELIGGGGVTAFNSNGFTTGTNGAVTASGDEFASWTFRKQSGVFDVVAYTGDTSSSSSPFIRTISHNLGVAPEMIIIKCRSNTGSWHVYVNGITSMGLLEDSGAFTTGQVIGTTTSTDFTLSAPFTALNVNGRTYISYLFATASEISKVGSYTGTAANLDVDCGFTSGARFVLVKRTDSTGDWYIWDSERGIVAGNDPYLLVNSTAAEVTSTDYIDPLSSGFTITSSAPAALNASGGTYIFLAIA